MHLALGTNLIVAVWSILDATSFKSRRVLGINHGRLRSYDRVCGQLEKIYLVTGAVERCRFGSRRDLTMALTEARAQLSSNIAEAIAYGTPHERVLSESESFIAWARRGQHRVILLHSHASLVSLAEDQCHDHS